MVSAWTFGIWFIGWVLVLIGFCLYHDTDECPVCSMEKSPHICPVILFSPLMALWPIALPVLPFALIVYICHRFLCN